MRKLLRGFLVLLLCITFFSCKNEPTGQKAEGMDETPEISAMSAREWAPEDTRSMTGITSQRGLLVKTDRDTEGLVLFEPPQSTESYLIDKEGRVVHIWQGQLNSMNSYLLPNGHLIRLERDEDFPTFAAGGQAGRIREYDWDGNLVWDFELANEKELLHHDIEIMPNGNILAISYHTLTPKEAIALGRDPKYIPKAGIWADKIIEIEPVKPEGGKIVWQWHMKDHFVQEFDPDKANYGVVAANPRKIDFNIHGGEEQSDKPKKSEAERQAELDKMKELGNETSNATLDNEGSDITHTNAISYNEALDQIVISVPELCEVFIIDHSTTSEEARGNTGGRWGHGGDLLYRWGNPANYGKGGKEDQILHFQHDVKWIREGYPGAGNLMVYNNDIPDPKADYDTPFKYFDSVSPPDFAIPVGKAGNHSAVHQWKAPTDPAGHYLLDSNGRFGPENPDETYKAPDVYSFYSAFISGAQRLENGNTLITQGMQGRLFEIDSENNIVWEYWVPYKGNYKLPDGSASQPMGPFIFGVFRSTLYPMDYPAFSNRSIGPLNPQPEPFKMPPPPPQDVPSQ
jgi:hypothetical protein